MAIRLWDRLTTDRWLPYMLLVPAVLVLLGFTIYPAVYALFISLTDTNLLNVANRQWVGLDNYFALWSDPIFRHAILRSIRWTISIVGLQLLVAMPVALFLDSVIRLKGIIRSIVLLPYVMPTAVVAVIWVYMFDANFGVVNEILVRSGLIEGPITWISHSTRSFFILLLAMVWQGMPLMAIILLAALQSFSPAIDEAARVDGANGWQRFWHVTLPQLMPTVWLLLMLRTMWMAHHVDLIFLLTNGGPGIENFTLPVYSYLVTTAEFRVGYSSALAVMLGTGLLIFAIAYMRRIEISREYL